MTKQMKAAMAAMLMVGTLPMQAQEPLSTTTKTVKVKPGETKTTVITKEQGTSTAGAKKRTTRKRTIVHHEPVESELSREIRELKEKQAAQQAEIDALTQANAAANAALASAQTATQAAQTQAQAATQQAQSVSATVQANSDAVQALKSNVSDLQTTNAGLASTISANKVELTDKIESPTVIHYKGVKITPVAFFAGEGVWRQRALNSDINTPLNQVPYNGASEAHVTELNFTARQSRLGGLFEGNTENLKISGYFESDFLGAGTTSNSNQSNSYLFRVRVAYAQAENKTGTAMAAGQTWSLVTEDQKGTNNRSEHIPQTIDSQYVAGFSWARQPGFRIQQRVGDLTHGTALTVAASVEEAQLNGYASAATPANFSFASAGNTSGLLNSTGNGSVTTGTPGTAVQNYSTNVAPDVVAKVALDAPHVHLEVGGVARFFRERIYPAVAGIGPTAPATAGAAPYNNTVTGGGIFGSARETSHFVDVGVSAMYGDGTARYGSGQLGDVTVHPNGLLEPIRNAHGLFSLETHPSPKLDIFGYYGGEYNQRTVYATGLAATPFTGYGSINLNDTGCATEVAPTSQNAQLLVPEANCSGVTRYLQEGVIGFIFKPIVSPKYGRLQYSATYSYVARTAWAGVISGSYTSGTYTTGSPKASDSMVHVGMRYYIP